MKGKNARGERVRIDVRERTLGMVLRGASGVSYIVSSAVKGGHPSCEDEGVYPDQRGL